MERDILWIIYLHIYKRLLYSTGAKYAFSHAIILEASGLNLLYSEAETVIYIIWLHSCKLLFSFDRPKT
jgi:hypothetical protein